MQLFKYDVGGSDAGDFDFEADLSEETKRLLLCDDVGATETCVRPLAMIQLAEMTAGKEQQAFDLKTLNRVTVAERHDENAESQFNLKHTLTTNDQNDVCYIRHSAGDMNDRMKSSSVIGSFQHLPVQTTSVPTAGLAHLSENEAANHLSTKAKSVLSADQVNKTDSKSFCGRITQQFQIFNKEQSLPALDGKTKKRSIQDKTGLACNNVKGQSVGRIISTPLAVPSYSRDCLEPEANDQIADVTSKRTPQPENENQKATRTMCVGALPSTSHQTGQQHGARAIGQSNYEIVISVLFT